MSDLSALFSCTYGTSAMDLLTYDVHQESVTRDGVGLVGHRVRVEASCELRQRDGNPASFVAAIAAAITDLQTGGRDFVVYGLGGAKEFELLAARCIYGGPFVNYHMRDGTSGLHKLFVISVQADVVLPSGNPPTPIHAFTVEVATSAEGLSVITRTGELHGVASADYFLSQVLPAIKTAYGPPNWSTDVRYEASPDQNLTKLTYTVVARQSLNPLPAVGGTYSVSGTADTHRERDERYRLVTDYVFDLVVVGDAIALISDLRRQLVEGRPDTPILHEAWQITSIDSQRVRAAFTLLESAGDGNNDGLMDYGQSLRTSGGEDEYDERTFNGADPVYVRKPATGRRIFRSGAIVAAGKFLRPPPALEGVPAAQSEETYDDLNDVEKKTSWSNAVFALNRDGTPIDFTTLLPDLLRKNLPRLGGNGGTP